MWNTSPPGAQLPLVRLRPFYPGQMGVPGSDVQVGARWAGRQLVFYVDAYHNGASDAGDGTDPGNPKATLQSAINQVVTFQTSLAEQLDGVVIVVSSPITESVTIPATIDVAGIIMGAAHTSRWPYWASAAADTPNLIIGARYWRVSGLMFVLPHEAPGVVLAGNVAPYAGLVAHNACIDNCVFNGGDNDGLTGIDIHGAPHYGVIMNNVFEFITEQGGAGIVCTDSTTDPLYYVIRQNLFRHSVGGIDAELSESLIMGNVFMTEGALAMTAPCDLRGGAVGENVVVGNYFHGDYSNTGGYYANAGNPGHWVGNFASDTAEAEVGDNGITIAPPAA